MSGRRIARIAALAIGPILLLAAWYLLAPPQLGGRTAYVTTVGSSMEPLVRPGDLVVVRRASGYRIGDVVAYRNPQLDSVVLHRIVARDGERVVLQGDSNTWTDSYHPFPEEIVGEMVLRLPEVGSRLGAVRTPIGASSLVALGAIGVLGGRRGMRGRRGRRHEERRGTAVSKTERRDERRPRAGARVGTAAAALAVLGGALCTVSFLAPRTETVIQDVAYDHRGSFSYQASVPGGERVYGADRVTTGEPVYLRLTDRVQVGFSYRFASAAATDLAGTGSLTAELSDVNGWSRTFELTPPIAFDGGEASLAGVLDLAALRRLADELERATGVDRMAYTLSVIARVEVQGTLAGTEIAETFEPRLAFLLDDLQLQLAPSSPADPGSDDPLEPAAGGLLEIPGTTPWSVRILGVDVGLARLRTAGLALLALGIVALLAALVRRVRAVHRGEPALIQARYGRWLVPVHTNGGYTPARLVEVESFESLLRLADHYGHMVLHDPREDGHVYVVEEGGVTYRYRARPTVRPGRR
jgi:signal peptidase I